ncbi:MAG: twin-arginine translocase subunit TatC [Verrucomicrobiota bacterium]
MFFLNKLFQLRDHGNPEAEKPFLDHLNDLRVTLTRIILTLAIGFLACFSFHKQLMDVIRRPVELAWGTSQNQALAKLDPKPDLETWERALEAASHLPNLSEDQQRHLIKSLSPDNPEFAFHVQSAFHFQVAQTLKGDSPKKTEQLRKDYFTTLPGISDKLRSQLLALTEGAPNARPDAKGRMVLMQSLNPTEGFMLSVKLAFFASLVVTFPLLLYFLLQFILPGLHDREQKALFPALGIGFLLFLGGVFFAYFIILPTVLDFFYQYSLEMGIQNDWRIGYYISFATQLVLIFGLSFELPVVVMTLVKLGILSYEMMRTTRSYAVLAIVITAAIITPTPDALTLGLLAIPMYILYEICIWLAFFLDRKEQAREAEEEKERMARLLSPSPAAGSIPQSQDDYHEEDEFDHGDLGEVDPDHIETDYGGPHPEEEDLHAQAPEHPEDDIRPDDDMKY